MVFFRPSPQTFFVEELPAYLPSGTGEHTFLWIEKRGMTTFAAVGELGRRLGVAAREIGYAGMKDRHATTRQWLSAQRVPPEVALGDADDAPAPLRILHAARHGNKLRVGHLRGNRFTVHLGGVRDAGEAAALEAGLAKLATGGLPNHYGDQRFGVTGSNVAEGLPLLRGGGSSSSSSVGGGRGPGPRDQRRRKLLLSAVQSAVFNAVLVRRQAEGCLRQVLAGDILQKTDNGGVFYTDDPELDQARVDAGAVVITGPLPGSWARAPAEGTPARAIEDAALADVGASREELGALGKELPGTRRPLWVPVVIEDQPLTETHPVPPLSTARGADGTRADHGCTLSFRLPAGTYATVLLSALGVSVEPAVERASDPGEDLPASAVTEPPAR